MFKIKMAATALFALLSATAPAIAASQFGPATDTGNAVSVQQILATPAAYVGKSVTVRGTVSEVCQKKGCWMQFQTDAAAPVFRLKVRDGEMVFPVSARGKTAYATGLLSAKTMTQSETQAYLAHRAEEQGEAPTQHVSTQSATPSAGASTVQPLTIYQLEPESVTIE